MNTVIALDGDEAVAKSNYLVMVEGPELVQVEVFASRIARVIEQELG